MAELAAAKAWLKAQLVASTALAAVVGTRIYEDHPPARSRTLPRVIYSTFGDAEDTLTGTGLVIMTEQVVEVVCELKATADTAAARATAEARAVSAKDAIDAALQPLAGTQDSHQIIGCLRDGAIWDEPDLFNGRPYYTVGGHYRVMVGQ